MTRERAKELLPIIKAFSEGREVQFIGYDGKWCSGIDLSFEKNTEYRIKPESSYRPWKPEEVPVGAILKSQNKQEFIIMGRNGGDVGVVLISEINKVTGRWQSFSTLHCTYSTDNGKTWLPCGVLIENNI